MPNESRGGRGLVESLASGTIADASESALIARIQALLPPAPPWLVVGIGDDAAVVEPERNRLDVLSVDTLVEGVHFDRAFVPPDAIGHRSLAVNLSDLAAMGAAPRLALLAMALPASLPLTDFDGIVAGIAALARTHKLHVVGGNLTRSPGPLMIDMTVSGTVKRRQVLTRSGARAGDDVYVSGGIGAARAGLQALRAVTSLQSPVASRAFLFPEPRVRLGMLLGRTRAATACIDLSDGMSDGVYRIAEMSRVGISIDADALPIEAATRAAYEKIGADPLDEALAGGDDYELLFTARPRANRRVSAAAREAGVPVTRVGVCTAERRLMLRRTGTEQPLARTGYDHFGA